VAGNFRTVLKRLLIGGVLSVGLLPGIAQAKWIKVSVTGTQGDPIDLSGQPVQLDFVLWNFNTITSNVWNQMGPAYGYAPLYGYGTGVSNSTPPTLQGPFLPQYTPGGAGNSFELKNDGTDLYMDLTGSTTIPYLGKGFPGNQGDTVTYPTSGNHSAQTN